jgi:hypothetical protein
MPCKAIAGKLSWEIGTTGNLHKHLYVVLERSWRLSGMIKKFMGADVKLVTPGTEATVIGYIGNYDKEVSKGCQILHKEEFGDIGTTQGQRNDISASDAVLWQIKDAIDAGESLRTIWNSFFPYMVRYGQGIKGYWLMNGKLSSEKINFLPNVSPVEEKEEGEEVKDKGECLIFADDIAKMFEGEVIHANN